MRAVLLAVLLVATGAAGQGFPLPFPPARTVVAYPPDGGMTVTGAVIVYPPDGGIEAIVTNRVNTSPVSAPDTSVFVTGVNGTRVLVDTGAVTIAGIPVVAFTPATLALMAGERDCDYAAIDNPLLDGGTRIYIKRVVGQTAVDLEAHDFGPLVDFVSCFPGIVDAGPYANCTIGDGGVGYALHNHGEVSWDVTDATEVSCIACIHGSNVAQQRAVMAGGVVSCVPAQ